MPVQHKANEQGAHVLVKAAAAAAASVEGEGAILTPGDVQKPGRPSRSARRKAMKRRLIREVCVGRGVGEYQFCVYMQRHVCVCVCMQPRR